MPPAGSGKHSHLNGGRGLAASGGGGTFETGWVTTYNGGISLTATNLGGGTWTTTAGSRENMPISSVNWYEAYAFCIWDGGFLPSEAEWEYAAAGGSQQRRYPWGSVPPGAVCPGTGCEYAIYGCYYPSGFVATCGVPNIAPVGTAALGVGLWGQLDLSGNVSQWGVDGYGPYGACTDCADLTDTSARVVRGGEFGADGAALVTTQLSGLNPVQRSDSIGFRCARAP
jgi:formylglycine-generating enzyme required for sulfatase activity